MSFLLYVGNYPTDFQKEELFRLFSGFTVRVERMKYKGSKTFAFVSCEDVYRGKAIIEKLNGTDVGGRRLVIQPCSDCLAEYRNSFLEDDGISKSDPDETADVERLRKRKDEKVPSVSLLESEQASSDRKFRDTELSESGPSAMPDRDINGEEKMHATSRDEDREDRETPDGQRSSGRRPASGPSERRNAKDENESHWVSVTNFLIGTNEELLYRLFSDYYPKDVKIICNEPRKDRRVTQALVSFPSSDAVFGVVLNFDNTLFWGRLISVEDLSDPDLSDDLALFRLQ